MLPVVASGVGHALLLLSLFGVRLHWPSAPLPIEIVRNDKPPQIPAAPRAPTPKHSGIGPRPHKAAPPDKPPPPVESLSGWAPNDSVVVVYLRMEPLRKSIYGPAAEELLARLPDYQTLLGDSSLSAVRDFDALFIATADPTDVRATFLLAKFGNSERIAPLLVHPLDPGDPREIHLIGPGLAGLGPPELWRPATDGGVPVILDGGVAALAAERWSSAYRSVDEHASADAALYVTIAGANRMVRLQDGTPLPEEADLVLLPERSPAVRVRARFATESEATRFAAQWPRMLESWRDAVGLFGIGPLFDNLVLTRSGAVVEWAGRIAEGQMTLALSYAKLIMPRPPLPERVAAPLPVAPAAQ